MRVMVLGKVPPIQGGVSAQTYWACQELASLGHTVDVITNGEDAAKTSRQLLWGQDLALRTFQQSSDLITLHDTNAITRAYIPFADPFVSKLFGVAVKIIEHSVPDIIVGSYFEPFGFAAALLGRIFHIPCVIQHAGSDIARLAKHPDLRSAYRWMLGSAERVITMPNSSAVVSLLEDLSVSPSKMRSIRRTRLPGMFSPSAAQLPLAEIQPQLSSFLNFLGVNNVVSKIISDCACRGLAPDVPTIGVYGKVGETKGTFDLINALAVIAEETEFNFVCIASTSAEGFETLVRRLGEHPLLLKRTVILPALAHWRMPNVIASLDVCCFLERNFPVGIHGSNVPREVLAMECCLVVSQEMRNKLTFGTSLIDGKNCYVVGDPENQIELISQVRRSLVDGEARRLISKHGRYLSDYYETTVAKNSGIDVILLEAIEEFRQRSPAKDGEQWAASAPGIADGKLGVVQNLAHD